MTHAEVLICTCSSAGTDFYLNILSALNCKVTLNLNWPWCIGFALVAGPRHALRVITEDFLVASVISCSLCVNYIIRLQIILIIIPGTIRFYAAALS